MEDNVARTLALAALGAAEEASKNGSYLIDLLSEGVITSGTFIEYDTTELLEAMNSGKPVIVKFRAGNGIGVSAVLSSFAVGEGPDVIGLNGIFQPNVGSDSSLFMNITLIFSAGGFTLVYGLKMVDEGKSYTINLLSRGQIASGTNITEFPIGDMEEAAQENRPIILKFQSNQGFMAQVMLSMFTQANGLIVGAGCSFHPQTDNETLGISGQEGDVKVTIIATGEDSFTLNYEFIPYYCINAPTSSEYDQPVLIPEQDIAINWSRINGQTQICLKGPFIVGYGGIILNYSDILLNYGASSLDSVDTPIFFLSPMGLLSGYTSDGKEVVIDLKIVAKDENTGTVKIRVIGDMKGATASSAGVGGFVPAPAAGDQDKVLLGSGQFGDRGVEYTELFKVTLDGTEEVNAITWITGNRASWDDVVDSDPSYDELMLMVATTSSGSLTANSVIRVFIDSPSITSINQNAAAQYDSGKWLSTGGIYLRQTLWVKKTGAGESGTGGFVCLADSGKAGSGGCNWSGVTALSGLKNSLTKIRNFGLLATTAGSYFKGTFVLMGVTYK